MAISGFKTRMFSTAKELADFAATNATTVYGIVVDNSGKFVLFYT